MRNCNYNQNECGSTCKYPNCDGWKASELKNTPWKAQGYGAQWCVIDSLGYNVAYYSTKANAKAIASLPDTLKRLEELEDAARPILATWEHSDGTERLSELFLNLKKALNG